MLLAYQSGGVGAVDTEEFDRRPAVGDRLCGLGEGARSGDLESRSSHSERPSCDTAGQHDCGGVEGRMGVADGRLALSCSSQQMMFAKVSAGSSDTDGKAKPCLPTSP